MVLYTILGAIVVGAGLRTLSNIFGGKTASQGNMFLAGLTPRTGWTIFGALLGAVGGFCYGGFRLFSGHYLPEH